MSDQPSEERPRDWMETWYETGEITWQPPPPLSAEARVEILKVFDDLTEEQKRMSSE